MRFRPSRPISFRPGLTGSGYALRAVGALLGALLGLTTATAAVAAPPDVAGKGELRRLGKTVIQYQDDAVRVVVSYRHANAHLASPWLLLDTAYMSTDKTSIEIAREDISLLLPDGTRVPLPSQKRVTEDFPDIRRFLNEASVARDPIEGYFNTRNREEPIRLFTIPGEGIVMQQFYAGRTVMAYGDLLFPSPKGSFPAGEYVLEIRNRDVDARIPFTLPAGDLDRQKEREKDKPITW